jgi:hypothetical protein
VHRTVNSAMATKSLIGWFHILGAPDCSVLLLTVGGWHTRLSGSRGRYDEL